MTIIITMIIIIIKNNNVKSSNSNDNMNVYIYINIKIHGDIANMGIGWTYQTNKHWGYIPHMGNPTVLDTTGTTTGSERK